MEKELLARIDELKADSVQPYVDSSIRARDIERLKRLEQLYDDLYGF